MPPHEPPFPRDSSEQLQFLDERQTILFLTEHGVRPLTVETWKQGEPFLFVLPAFTRSDTASYRTLKPEKRPVVVRVARPSHLTQPQLPNATWTVRIEDNSPVDYFAIHPVTKQITRVKTSTQEEGTIPKVYAVTPDMLFAAHDTLFPPSR